MKDTFYFSHDYNSRSDTKIKKLIQKHGFLGYGLFWAIIEDLYNNANALPTDYECIAFELRTTEKIIKSIINEFDLFVLKDGFFGSLSVQRRLDERNEKSIKARKSAFNRWNKSERNANALPTESECNAIKEIKGKESKVKESINDNDLKNDFEIFRKQYSGVKRGLNTEFENFKKHKDYKEACKLLLLALEKEKANRDLKSQNKQFVAEWKNLKTWINQRCWEQEFEESKLQAPIKQEIKIVKWEDLSEEERYKRSF